MANSVNPDQTAPIGANCSGSTLFASIVKSVSNVRQHFAADDFSRRHFSDAFFLGTLRIKVFRKVNNQKYFSYFNFCTKTYVVNTLRNCRLLIVRK